MNLLPDPNANAAYLLFLFASPLLVALVKQSGLSTAQNAIIAQVVYVIVGIAAAIWSGIPVTAENAIPLITTATIVGSAAYGLLWSKIGGDDQGVGSVDDRVTTRTSIVK